jgi:glycosyltransferase involved in cell wall biosynthesis
MRVLHVTDTFLPKIGGAEIAIDQLARAMPGAGVDCAVLAQRQREAPGEVSTPYPLRRYANPRASAWVGWWIQRRLARVEQELGRFDALIGHHAFPPGYACVGYARHRGIPSIVYPRGGDIYQQSRYRRKPLAWRRLGWALRNASAIICASAQMEQIVREILGNDGRGRLVRIPNGVNLEELTADSSASRFASDPRLAAPFILGLGRAITRKGFDLLIDAFATLGGDVPRLVIAGDGRELPALKDRARSLGDRVIFTGMVEGADKRWLLGHCRFMAAPSREESFGNVALEAMACGKPVVASRASGFAEIVEDGANGRLIDLSDSAGLAEALVQYASASLEAQCAAALETAKRFAWPTIARRYAELIERLVAGQTANG